jgi:hypothetical protein
VDIVLDRAAHEVAGIEVKASRWRSLGFPCLARCGTTRRKRSPPSSQPVSQLRNQ